MWFDKGEIIMADYKIGEILISTKDQELDTMFGDKVIIPKGSKVIIGADRLAHHFRDGKIQPISKDSTVKGYDSKGIAEYLFTFLSCIYPMNDMLDDYDISEDEFKKEIEYRLCEIGLG